MRIESARQDGLWVVIPCFMSTVSLVEVVHECHEVFGSHPNFLGVVLVVDGPNQEAEAIARISLKPFPRDVLIVLARNVGQHAATLAGIRAIGNGLALTIDDDGQNDPLEGRAMIEHLVAHDLDVVYGVSSGFEHARWRNLLSRKAKVLISRVSGAQVTMVSSFRAIRTAKVMSAYPEVPPQPNLDAMLYWSTSQVGRYDVKGRSRREGKSTYGIQRLIRYGWGLLTTFSYVPLRLITYLGLFAALASMVLLVYFLAAYLFDHQRVSGFTALATVLTASAAIQFVALGVIGEYLSRVHIASVAQPAYVIQRQALSQDLPEGKD